MSICKDCFHSYVCEQFNEHRECDNTKCYFFNDHFVSTKDVVKVVRCKDCDNCVTDENTSLMMTDALDLINRLQADVEKCEKVEYFADKTIATLQAENERLKKSLEQCEDSGEYWESKYNTTKAEAYKEFAERLKEKAEKKQIVYGGALVRTDYTMSGNQLNNLLKELVGEDNG